MPTKGKLPSILQILITLEEQGWIPLRSMAILLGYKQVRGIYQRQRGPNAIQIIQVGGVKRVYEDVVLETLRNIPTDKLGSDGLILQLYKDQVKRNKHNKTKQEE